MKAADYKSVPFDYKLEIERRDGWRPWLKSQTAKHAVKVMRTMVRHGFRMRLSTWDVKARKWKILCMQGTGKAEDSDGWKSYDFSARHTPGHSPESYDYRREEPMGYCFNPFGGLRTAR